MACSYRGAVKRKCFQGISLPWISSSIPATTESHDDVIKWKTFSALLAICAGNPRWIPRTKAEWRGALMFSLICAWQTVAYMSWLNMTQSINNNRADSTLTNVSCGSYNMYSTYSSPYNYKTNHVTDRMRTRLATHFGFVAGGYVFTGR